MTYRQRYRQTYRRTDISVATKNRYKIDCNISFEYQKFKNSIQITNENKLLENFGTNPIVPGGGVPGPGPVPGNQIWNGAPQQSVSSPWNPQQRYRKFIYPLHLTHKL